jgi:hypothetical protein
MITSCLTRVRDAEGDVSIHAFITESMFALKGIATIYASNGYYYCTQLYVNKHVDYHAHEIAF